jgi:hypothetical protein
MNRLPIVLQKEIWEYVQGDRAYWKSRFQCMVNHLEIIIDFAEAATFDLAFPPRWQTKPQALFGSAMKWKQWSLDDDSALDHRRWLSRHNYPMYCDSREDYVIINLQTWGGWRDYRNSKIHKRIHDQKHSANHVR